MILSRLDTPGPSVDVLVDSALPGTVSVTVWRTAAGHQHKVRGMIGRTYLGAVSGIDYDVPLNTVAEYRVECFDDEGERIGFTTTESITIEAGGSWLHNPLAPLGAVPVVALDSTAREMSRPTVSQIVHPIGRRVGVVVGSGRRGLAGFRFDVWSDSLEKADQIQALIGDESINLPPVLCVRVGGKESRMRIPKPLYLHVSSIVEEDAGVRNGEEDTLQLMEGDEAAAPTPALFIPLLRRMDVDAYYATRDDIDQAYQDRVSIDRDYEIAGFADA